jgi:signal transduction histidine kinase
MEGALDTAEYFENPVRTHDGTERLIAWHNKLVYDNAGNIIGTISSGTDITERKKAERELQELNETLEQRVLERTAVAEQQAKKLRALTRELIQAELQERRRIALLLHEHFQQLLVAARMNLTQVLQHADAPDLRDLLKGTDGILRDAIESSRTLAVELCPPLLYELGLVPALEWLGKRMYERHALDVQIDANLDREPEDLDLRSFCFEAVRELLFNVVKHSGVLSAQVCLRHEKEFLEIRVSDEGRGFDPQHVQPLGTDSLDFGLFAIRERLSSLGGRIELASAPGEGTQVTFLAPLRLESN